MKMFIFLKQQQSMYKVTLTAVSNKVTLTAYILPVSAEKCKSPYEYINVMQHNWNVTLSAGGTLY
jgi:hypothetical protein